MKAVNADDVLKILHKYGKYIFVTDEKRYSSMVDEIASIKALEQEKKTGHWINAKVGKLFPSNDFKCSECGNILDFDGVNCGRGDANYCPNCGCHMVEPQESEG